MPQTAPHTPEMGHPTDGTRPRLSPSVGVMNTLWTLHQANIRPDELRAEADRERLAAEALGHPSWWRRLLDVPAPRPRVRRRKDSGRTEGPVAPYGA